MKKKTIILSAILTAAMMAAPMSVFAAPPSASDPGVTLGDPVGIGEGLNAQNTTINQESTDKSGSMTATYSVTPSYTVTIPASVTLSSTQNVTATIQAENVILEEGKCVEVKLTQAQYTEEGSMFNAKVGNSTANYTITDNEQKMVSVGGVVAKFGSSAEPQTSVLTFSRATGATYAGTHTETLTFSLAVVDSTVMIGSTSYTYTPGQTWRVLAEANSWGFDEDWIYLSSSTVLFCEGNPVSPDQEIDGSKTYYWEDFFDT